MRTAALLLACLGLGACTLIIDANGDQCVDDGFCIEIAGPGATCQAGFCVETPDETGSGSTTAPTAGSTSTSTTDPDPASTSSSTAEDASDETGPPVDPAWGCLENPLPIPDEDVTLSIRFADVVTGQAPNITSARLCALLDSACMSPIMDLDFVDGVAEGTVAPGFGGYVMAIDIIPSVVYVAPALRSEERYTPLVPDALIDTSASLLGLTFNRKERGIMIAQVLDCTGNFAPGITMNMSKADKETVRFFGMLPDDEATATGPDGTGGFLNVPEGFGTWDASVEATGQVVKELRFVHRAGWASLVVSDATQEFATE